MTSSTLKDAFAAFFSPRSVIPFLFGAVVVGVLSNTAHQLLTNLFGTRNSSLFAVAVVTLLAFLLAMAASLWRGPRPPVIPPLANPRRPAKRRGLIYLYNRREPCEVAVKYHAPQLKRLWLISSPQTNESAHVAAAELASEFGLDVEVRLVDNVHDPLETYLRVEGIYHALPPGWSIDDVISDYTGMTAHASIGMTLACLRLDAPLQYTPARYDAPNKPPTGSDPPFEVVLQGRRVPPSPNTPAP